jgi:hypothetical protein
MKAEQQENKNEGGYRNTYGKIQQQNLNNKETDIQIAEQAVVFPDHPVIFTTGVDKDAEKSAEGDYCGNHRISDN